MKKQLLITKRFFSKMQKKMITTSICEDFISFSDQITKHLQSHFLDSVRFMSMSLGELADVLPKDEFIKMKKYYDGENFELATWKGVFPFGYIRSMLAYDETQLPRKHIFYSCIIKERYQIRIISMQPPCKRN